MKVLIAVDDSRCSKAAMSWVKEMRWNAGTEFIVLSAARLTVPAYAFADIPMTLPSNEINQEQVRLHEEIAARFERQIRERGYPTRALVREGDPREVILEVAREFGVDLVVVGSHGRSGITKLMLGSVASHVVTHAPCPVTVIKGLWLGN
jgi:universal stress protein A